MLHQTTELISEYTKVACYEPMATDTYKTSNEPMAAHRNSNLYFARTFVAAAAKLPVAASAACCVVTLSWSSSSATLVVGAVQRAWRRRIRGQVGERSQSQGLSKSRLAGLCRRLAKS